MADAVKKYRVFTDGSFNKANPNETHGGIVYWDLENDKPDTMFHITCTDARLCSGWNVGGEVIAGYLAVWGLVQQLMNEGRTADDYPVEIELVYDYEGVGNWMNGTWKNAKSPSAKWYKEKMTALINSCPNLWIKWVWVRAHTGLCAGNTLADKVASCDGAYWKNGANGVIHIPIDNADMI